MVSNTYAIASIFLFIHGLLTIYGMLELTAQRAMHRDFVIVLTTISKYITLFVTGMLFFGLMNSGSIDKYLNLMFDVMFVYLGPWAIHSAALEYYYEDEIILKGN